MHQQIAGLYDCTGSEGDLVDNPSEIGANGNSVNGRYCSDRVQRRLPLGLRGDRRRHRYGRRFEESRLCHGGETHKLLYLEIAEYKEDRHQKHDRYQDSANIWRPFPGGRRGL